MDLFNHIQNEHVTMLLSLSSATDDDNSNTGSKIVTNSTEIQNNNKDLADSQGIPLVATLILRNIANNYPQFLIPYEEQILNDLLLNSSSSKHLVATIRNDQINGNRNSAVNNKPSSAIALTAITILNRLNDYSKKAWFYDD